MKKEIIALGILLALLSGCVVNDTGMATATEQNQQIESTENETIEQQPKPTIQSETGNSHIAISLAELSEEAKWFETESDGVTIRFFAVKARDGSIRTAFDACDVCYGSRKGYSQQGKEMVCNNCGNKYPIDGLGTENKRGGGCWPGYLPSKVVGDQVVIEKADIEAGRYRFA